eukprot:Skav205789  [mRNA]  locus=scaffold340:232682:235681:+ [translate_table: standard]
MRPASLPSHVDGILDSFDYVWSQEKQNQRGTFMVVCQRDHESSESLMVKIWQPEGIERKSFWEDHLTMPIDRDTGISKKMIWKTNEMKPEDGKRIWICNLLQCLEQNEEVFVMDEMSYWMEVPQTRVNQSLTVVEMFAGGFAGWSMAWKSLEETKTNRIAIDSDEAACTSFAVTHEASFLPRGSTIEADVFERKGESIIWQADIADERQMAQVTKLCPDLVTISAPCPAWSGASGAEGMNRTDGELMLKALLQCRVWRPKVIALEQVSNFNSHEHKQCIMKAIQYMGYRLQWQRVLNLDRHCQTSRCRWLALITRVCETDLIPLIPWPTRMEDHPDPVLRLALDDLHTMSVDAKAKEIASNPAMMKNARNMQPEQVMKQRIYSNKDTIPCFMAQYGNQHNLAKSRLEQSGYMGHFLATNQEKPECRFWHPAEVALLHGVQDQYWVDADLPTSWKITGNCIGTPHALMVLCNALQHFEAKPCIQEAFRRFHDKKLRAAECELINNKNGQLLKKSNTTIPRDALLRYDELYEHISAPGEWWHPGTGWNQHDAQPNEVVQACEPTQEDVSSTAMNDIDPTARMFGHYEAFLCFGGSKQQFWHSNELRADQVEAHWQGAYWNMNRHEHGGRLQLMEQPYGPDQIIVPCNSVPVLTAHDMTIVKTDENVQYKRQPQFNEYTQLFDQYGAIADYQTPRADDVLMDAPWEFNKPQDKIVPLTKALMSTQTTWHWDPHEDMSYIKVHGSKEDSSIAVRFWSNLLTQDTLNRLGRQVNVCENMIRFMSLSTKVACPNRPFRLGITVQATKALLSICRFQNTEETYPVKMRLFGRPLWEGNLPANLSIDVVKTILKLGMKLCTHQVDYRIIVQARQIYDSTIEELFREGKHKLILHAVGSQRGGGGEGQKGAKHQLKQQLQAALASILLDQGHPLEWTKNTVDQIVWKCGLPRLQALVAQPKGPAKIQSILELCKELGISQLDMPRPQSQAKLQGIHGKETRKDEIQTT